MCWFFWHERCKWVEMARFVVDVIERIQQEWLNLKISLQNGNYLCLLKKFQSIKQSLSEKEWTKTKESAFKCVQFNKIRILSFFLEIGRGKGKGREKITTTQCDTLTEYSDANTHNCAPIICFSLNLNEIWNSNT